MSLNIREEAPTTSAPAREGTSCQGPSWLQSGFVMPTDEEALRALVVEISACTPLLLNNILFTNMYATLYLGGAILDQTVDVESPSGMGEMGVDEATNRVGPLLPRVSSRLFFLFCFECLPFFFFLTSMFLTDISLNRFYCQLPLP